jgi:pimeloyl-ACP methyl ester carboxylesterase
MATADSTTTALIPVGGTSVELYDRGSGPTILLLHGAGGLKAGAPFLRSLSAKARVVAPSHPGFGRSPLPEWISSIDDLAYLYLDLLEQLDLRDVTLVGMSMGGWTAAEIAVKNSERLARIVLADPVGIKPSGREVRDIPDIWALDDAAIAKLTQHDPTNAPDYGTMSDEDLEVVARNREAAALYLWEPYMHNPQLLRRLHRIKKPTLFIRGASDGLVSAAYVRAYSEAIPGSRIVTIERAGHAPANERPDKFVETVLGFMGE